MRKPQEPYPPRYPTPLRNDAGPLSGLQSNALASLVRFGMSCELGMQVHCVGGQRGGQHCSVVG